MGLGLTIILCLKNLLDGSFGQLGGDSDDLLRFVQIRDYLQGQSWFDTDQYRMGLTAAGTDMHWSRLPDIPIILLTHIFDIFTTQDKALDLAISIWPPLSGVILFIAILIGGEQVKFEGDRKYLRVFTTLLVTIFVISNFRFASGSIDHHNIQFGFIALAMVWAMDQKMRASRYFLSALATAICISIGPEVYLFVAVICGFIAINWAVKGEASARATQSFGCGLAFGVAVTFFATVPPESYGVVYCDALSLITLTAAIFGGLGLALAVKTRRYYGGVDSCLRRFIALAVLGAICLAALSFQAPQCLSNPLDSLPPEVIDLWLNAVSEAAPIYDLSDDWPMFIPMVVGPVLAALCSLIYGYYQAYKTIRNTRGKLADLWNTDALITLLLLAAIVLTIYQVRFSPFAYIFSILILTRWIARSYGKGLEKGGTNVIYIACLALSIPILWAIPGAPFVSSDSSIDTAEPVNIAAKTNVKDATDCGSDEVIAALNSLPTGLISASSNAAGTILIHTDHRVVSGNYHRNWAGISTEINIAIAAPDEAHSLLTDNKVDYLYYCKAKGLARFSKYNPDGLTALFEAGNIPDFLVPAINTRLENGDALIFKVIPKP